MKSMQTALGLCAALLILSAPALAQNAASAAGSAAERGDAPAAQGPQPGIEPQGEERPGITSPIELQARSAQDGRADQGRLTPQDRFGGEDIVAVPPGTSSVAGGRGEPGQTIVGTGAVQGPEAARAAEEMVGRTLVNANGQTLGRIEMLVRDKQDQSLKAVVAHGGFLGIGGKQTVVPLDQIEASGGRQPLRLRSEMGPEELGQLSSYRPENFEPVTAAEAPPSRG